MDGERTKRPARVAEVGFFVVRSADVAADKSRALIYEHIYARMARTRIWRLVGAIYRRADKTKQLKKSARNPPRQARISYMRIRAACGYSCGIFFDAILYFGVGTPTHSRSILPPIGRPV